MDLEERFERAMMDGRRHDAFMAMLRYRVELVAQDCAPETVRRKLENIVSRVMRGVEKKEEHGNE